MTVEADRFTYGQGNIKIVTNFPGKKVKLGKYCSVAADVQAFLGGNHRVDWITTFPFGHTSTSEINVSKVDGHPGTNGDIIIGNDVWLGTGCVLMSGITIGDGAVVAAHSHVVKDVAPYTLVGGNPAKLIRYRFNDEVIEQLLATEWWSLSEKQLTKYAHLFNNPDQFLISFSEEEN